MSNDNGIYERPDSPYWWACWMLPSGKTARRSTRIRRDLDPNGIEAQRIRESFIHDAPRVISGRNNMLWEELVEAYLPVLKRRCKDSTFIRYRHALKQLLPYFAGKPAAMPSSEVKTYIRMRENDGYANATINIDVGLMQGMYSWAIDELELDIRNPWARRTLPTNNARERFLTREEVDRLMEIARGQYMAPYLADVIIISVHTGMRRNEVLKLSWDRVDLENGVITFGKDQQKNGKAGAIPINASARLAFLSLKEKGRSPIWVVSDFKGARIASIEVAWQTCKHKAGLSDIQMRDLRRTFASWLVQSNVPIKTVSNLMRHSDIKITAKVYGHLDQATLKEAAAVLDTPPRLKIVGT
jgi:integrase